MEKLRTIGQVAVELRIPTHAAQYLAASRRVEPVVRVGRYKVYNSQGVEAIRAALANSRAARRV